MMDWISFGFDRCISFFFFEALLFFSFSRLSPYLRGISLVLQNLKGIDKVYVGIRLTHFFSKYKVAEKTHKKNIVKQFLHL